LTLLGTGLCAPPSNASRGLQRVLFSHIAAAVWPLISVEQVFPVFRQDALILQRIR